MYELLLLPIGGALMAVGTFELERRLPMAAALVLSGCVIIMIGSGVVKDRVQARCNQPVEVAE